MDGENNGKPLLKWMIGGYHYFRKHYTRMFFLICLFGGWGDVYFKDSFLKK